VQSYKFIVRLGWLVLLANFVFSCARASRADWETTVAVHESGHAMAAALERNIWLYEVTVVPGENSAGATDILCQETEEGLLSRIRVHLAGYLAEEEMFGHTDDTVANIFGNCYGSDVKLLLIDSYRYVKKDPNLKITALTQLTEDERKEVRNLISTSIAAVRKTLKEHKKQLRAVAEALGERKTLSGEEVRKIMEENK
jgi:ATP-dependent Zn protease